MRRYPLRYVGELTVGALVAALVLRTWLVMGSTVAGSSMAPTLHGPHRVFHCPDCQAGFSVGLDELPGGLPAYCPACDARLPVVMDGHDVAGDRVIIDRAAFLWRKPRRWEVVAFRCPEAAGELCVKRIVGLPGERVAFADGQLLINGEAEPKPTAIPQSVYYEVREGDRPSHEQHPERGSPESPFWQLGPDEYFVVGDNAALSVDSRTWLAGPGLDAKLLIGKPLGVR
jgi:signal peptidase I